MVICFVPECNHYSNEQNRICSHFFRFPTNEKLKKKWITNIRRGDKEPSKHSMVCSCHFKDQNKTNGPTIFKRIEGKILKCTSPEKRQRKPSDLQAVSLPSTSAGNTTCETTTPQYMQRKPDYSGAGSSLPSTSAQGTDCDKTTQTDPLHLQLQEQIRESKRLRAELESFKQFKLSSTDSEDEDKDPKNKPDMAEYASKVFQFKVSLQHITPQIWRRFQVPADFNFRELHLAIQCAMGWENYHLYVFRMGDPFLPFFDEDIRIGNVLDGEDIISALDVKLPEYFKQEKSQGVYEYDFGQCWLHDVVLEKILPRIEGETYPKCIGGKRACPPEDGVFPPSDSEDDDETKEWKRKMRDPELFDVKDVKFDFELIDNDF